MSVLISMLAYGKHVSMNTGTMASMWWSADKQTLYLRGKPIIVCRFREMAQKAVADAEDML
jgi:hypothetical protein